MFAYVLGSLSDFCGHMKIRAREKEIEIGVKGSRQHFYPGTLKHLKLAQNR